MKKGSIHFSSPISRRTLLRTAGGATLALPLFESLVAPEARAQNAMYPKRLCILFTPNGSVPANYFGSGNTSTFTPGSIFDPLMTHKDDILILDRLDMQAAQTSQGDAHGVGMGCMLTGKNLQTGEMFGAGMGGPGSGWADNISIDQVVAQTVGMSTKLRSLELAGKRFQGNVWSRMSYTGPAVPVNPLDNPQVAFDTVFKDVGMSGSPEMDRRIARRRSVLDNAVGELATLRGRLGVEDRVKLDTHTAALEDIESRLNTMSSTTCTVPTRPTVMASPPVMANSTGMEVINAADDVDFPKAIAADLDIIAGAFACDVTRVASLIFCPSRSDVVMSWVNYNGAAFRESHHEVSHYTTPTEKERDAKLTRMNQWYAEQISSFVTKLKSVPEGDGTLFDNTLIVWVNELGEGPPHSHTRIPFSIIGACQGHFRTGRYVSFPAGTYHNDLLVSIAQAMGVEITTFGDTRFSKGPLTGLTA
jgi:hypothetical protein